MRASTGFQLLAPQQLLLVLMRTTPLLHGVNVDCVAAGTVQQRRDSTAAAATTTAAAVPVLNLDLRSPGAMFEGVGALSGGGGSCTTTPHTTGIHNHSSSISSGIIISRSTSLTGIRSGSISGSGGGGGIRGAKANGTGSSNGLIEQVSVHYALIDEYCSFRITSSYTFAQLCLDACRYWEIRLEDGYVNVNHPLIHSFPMYTLYLA